MRIVLYCSAFNGLSQRAWIELRAAGHDVTVHLASDATTIERRCRQLDPDLVLCPYLTERVPASVWRRTPTIIIHPGPPGDRGPSSLDWAIAEGATRWGVTALQAVEEMDAGPVLASRTFDLPTEPIRKSALYNGVVTDAAIELITEVVATMAATGAGRATSTSGEAGRATRSGPVPLVSGAGRGVDVTGRPRPTMTQADRAFRWEDPTVDILRAVRAADGWPGVRTSIGGHPLSVFDAHPGPADPAFAVPPGFVVGHRHGAVLVTTGDGSLWIGQVRDRIDDGRRAIKLPAATVLRSQLRAVPSTLDTVPRITHTAGPPDISYHRVDDVGVLGFEAYNGACSTAFCRRLTAALRLALLQDTRVVVLRGGATFSNGIDLNTIEASPDPAAEAWANIQAIDDLCQTIITATDKLIVASIGASAGAGGVMVALGADRVYLRASSILNPHYATMGLYGSEYWTYVLPRRVGRDEAMRLTDACLPVGAARAARIGLVDRVIDASRAAFEAAVVDESRSLAAGPGFERALRAKQQRRREDERRKPLEAYRHEELGQMGRDLFDDRSGFAAARRAFVLKRRPDRTPPHLSAA